MYVETEAMCNEVTRDLPTVDCTTIIVAKVKTKRQHILLTFLILIVELTKVKRNKDCHNCHSNGCITVQAFFYIVIIDRYRLCVSFHLYKTVISQTLHVVLCPNHPMPCHAMPCHAMLCRAELWFDIRFIFM